MHEGSTTLRRSRNDSNVTHQGGCSEDPPPRHRGRTTSSVLSPSSVVGLGRTFSPRPGPGTVDTKVPTLGLYSDRTTLDPGVPSVLVLGTCGGRKRVEKEGTRHGNRLESPSGLSRRGRRRDREGRGDRVDVKTCQRIYRRHRVRYLRLRGWCLGPSGKVSCLDWYGRRHILEVTEG